MFSIAIIFVGLVGDPKIVLADNVNARVDKYWGSLSRCEKAEARGKAAKKRGCRFFTQQQALFRGIR